MIGRSCKRNKNLRLFVSVVPIELRFDLDHQSIELRAQSLVMQSLELPESVRISKLVVGGAVA